MGSVSQAAGAGGSIVGDLIGGFMGQNQQDWYKNALVNILNNLNTANSTGLQYGYSQFNPASASAQQLLGLASQLLFGHDGIPGSLTGLQDQFQSSLGGINQGQFQNSALTDPMQQILQSMGSTAGATGNAAGLLNNVIANGGGSVPSQQIWDYLNNIASGRGANNQALGNTAFSLLTNPQTALTSGLQGQGLDTVSNGGMTPALQNALGYINTMINAGGSNSNIDQGVSRSLDLSNGSSPIINALMGAGGAGLSQNPLGVAGLTPTGAVGEQNALGGIQNAGATPTTNFFTNRGEQLASQDAVMPAMLAASFAKDNATTQYKNAAEAARAQALARGGGPGSVVANGTTNQALGDFADQGAAGVSGAVQNALLNQQALNLQQQGQGAQMGLQGGNLQLGNLNDYSSLLSQLENSATNRFGVSGGLLGSAGNLSNAQSGLGLSGLENLSGLQSNNILSALGMIPGVQNSATGTAGTFGNLGLGAGQLQLGNQTLGGNLTNSFNNNIMNALQGMQGNLNQANNYTLGASGALNNFTGTTGGILNNMFGNNLGAGQLGLGQTSNYYNALNSLFSQGNTLTNNELGMFNPGLSTLTNIGNAGFNYANTANQGMPHIFSNYTPGNALGQGIQNASGGIGSLLSAFGF